MAIPGKLTVRGDGRVAGARNIIYNNPFPCVNGRMGVTGKMMGAVMHTIVGNVNGANAVFNNPATQASAHFAVDQNGDITQYGPIGKGWEAWHAFAANTAWYGIEHADNGNTRNPLTEAQIEADAQLLECLSAFAGFPLNVSNDPAVKGYAYHSLVHEWNLSNHSCPGPGPRAGQRGAIVALARQIRAGVPVPPPAAELHCPAGLWTALPAGVTHVMPADHDVVLKLQH